MDLWWIYYKSVMKPPKLCSDNNKRKMMRLIFLACNRGKNPLSQTLTIIDAVVIAVAITIWYFNYESGRFVHSINVITKPTKTIWKKFKNASIPLRFKITCWCDVQFQYLMGSEKIIEIDAYTLKTDCISVASIWCHKMTKRININFLLLLFEIAALLLTMVIKRCVISLNSWDEYISHQLISN